MTKIETFFDHPDMGIFFTSFLNIRLRRKNLTANATRNNDRIALLSVFSFFPSFPPPPSKTYDFSFSCHNEPIAQKFSKMIGIHEISFYEVTYKILHLWFEPYTEYNSLARTLRSAFNIVVMLQTRHSRSDV